MLLLHDRPLQPAPVQGDPGPAAPPSCCSHVLALGWVWLYLRHMGSCPSWSPSAAALAHLHNAAGRRQLHQPRAQLCSAGARGCGKGVEWRGGRVQARDGECRHLVCRCATAAGVSAERTPFKNMHTYVRLPSTLAAASPACRPPPSVVTLPASMGRAATRAAAAPTTAAHARTPWGG